MDLEIVMAEIPEGLARSAHAWTSFVPEDRARQEREGYARTMMADFEYLSGWADSDLKKADLAREFERYKAGYRRRFMAHLAAKSRCASTMITGGSGFNVSRNEKANRRADKHNNDLHEFRKRALVAIHKVLRPELAPIMKGDANASERLEDKIKAAEAMQEKMRACNAVIRKHAKKGADAQVAALVALGYGGEGWARDLLSPDGCGRIGYADYELTNNNANIRRMRSRLVEVERAHSTPGSETEGANARLEDAPAENRVRLHFPGKPSLEVRSRLKSAGFRWAPTQGAWSAYRNHGTLATAKSVAGIE